MTIKEVLDRTTIFFKEKKFDSPRLDAEILLSKALGLKRIDLYLKFESPLSEAELETCRNYVRRRTAGEPVAYILGEKEFFGSVFKVDQNVLIPRPETELLVEEVLLWVQKNSLQDEHLNILDLGTGSGCIGLSLLKKLPNAKVTLVDVSAEALNVAKRNAQNLNLEERCKFLNQDAEACDLGSEQFQIIVANPPYIDPEDPEIMPEVKKFEPHQALFSNDKGLYHLKKWSEKYVKLLSDLSIIPFEFGHQQSKFAKEYFQKLNSLNEIKLIRDLSGIDRHIIGIKRKE